MGSPKVRMARHLPKKAVNQWRQTAIMDPPKRKNLHLLGSLPRKRLQPKNLPKRLQPRRDQLKRLRLLLELWHLFEDNPKSTMLILHLRRKRSLHLRKKKNLNLKMKCQSREERREPKAKANPRKKPLLQKRNLHT